jgi:hypothetical protein
MIVAAECRMAWVPACGMRAVFRMFRHSSQSARLSIGRPFGWVNTRSKSSQYVRRAHALGELRRPVGPQDRYQPGRQRQRLVAALLDLPEDQAAGLALRAHRCVAGAVGWAQACRVGGDAHVKTA